MQTKLSLSLLILFLGLSSWSCRFLVPEKPADDQAQTSLVVPSLRPTARPVSTVASKPTPQSSPTLSDDCPNGDCVVACMNSLSGQTLEFSGPGEDSIDDQYYKEEGLTLASYAVHGDEIALISKANKVPKWLTGFRDDQAFHQELWTLVSMMIPSDFRSYVREFHIVTDGVDETLATTYQTEDDMNAWIVDVDILDSTDLPYFISTIAHEMSHLITLNPEQVKQSAAIFDDPENSQVYEEEAAACPTYFPDSCSKKSSYINLFYERFWKNHKDYDRWVEINSMDYGDKYDKALERFYKAHKDEFVTEYAATNLDEDMAEAFTLFLLESKPSGKTIAEKKILFFYEFPELLAYRRDAARSICGLKS